MATISTQLRKFKEPTREELTRHFFGLPPLNEGDAQPQQGPSKSEAGSSADGEERGGIEVNAVLSLGQEGVEDSYVCTCIMIILPTLKTSLAELCIYCLR